MAFGVDDPTSVSTMPSMSATSVNGWFQGGDYTQNIQATPITTDWLNGVQAEILNVVEGGGLTPTKSITNQMYQAIVKLIKDSQGEQYIYFCTPSSIAGNTTTYIGPSGVSTSDNGAKYVVPNNSLLTGLVCFNTVAPGTGNNTTISIYNNGSLTSASATISATSNSATFSGSYTVSSNDALSIHITQSSASATTYCRGYFVITPV